jgi:hypothetical protein
MATDYMPLAITPTVSAVDEVGIAHTCPMSFQSPGGSARF